MLDEFYQNISSVGVSAVTGEGMDDFFQVRGARTRTHTHTHTFTHAQGRTELYRYGVHTLFFA